MPGKPKILVDSFPPCLSCGDRVTSARLCSLEQNFILWSRSKPAVLLRPCGDVLTGDTYTIWVSDALRRAS